MRYRKEVTSVIAVLLLGASSTVVGQDASPPPSSSSAGQGSSGGEATIGTVPEREDDLGTARDEPERDMLGTGAAGEPVSGDGTGQDSMPPEGQAADSPDRAGTSVDDIRAHEDPGLDEPRQPIRPGQMEQEVERQE
ncbi:hypothetical protein ACOJCM_05655 [Billgrantia sp. LNSP4103-1]|uniref:hypothetical protein n=1 Tax=Billgrantia sp. LNSP4103-1 TaxID=3410266 RepID=UPI00403F7D60